MEKIKNWLNNYLMPALAKVGYNRYLKAVSNAFISMLPVTIIGSLFTLLANFPSIAVTDWFTKTGLINVLKIPGRMTVDLISVYAVFFFGYHLAKSFKKEIAVPAGLVSLISFFIVTPIAQIVTDTATINAIPFTYLGAKGLFTAIFVGLIASRLYILFDHKGFTIKMPEGVPEAVSSSFSSLIPAGITIVIMLVFSGLIAMTSYGSVSAMIYTIIQSNLMKIAGNSLPIYCLFMFLASLLWIFGLNGGSIMISVVNPIFMPLALENLAAYQAGEAMPHILTRAFDYMFNFGGTGSLLALCILITFFSKSKRYKMIGRLALPASIFNISEPMMFGVPVVLNPIFVIPMLFIPVIMASVSYFVCSIGLIPIPNGVQIPWTCPPIISGFLLGGWRMAIWQVAVIVVEMAMYYPFFKYSDRKILAEEQQGVTEEIQAFSLGLE